MRATDNGPLSAACHAASLQEKAEAIGWYEQRIALGLDPQAKAIMRDAEEDLARRLHLLTTSLTVAECVRVPLVPVMVST